MVRAIVSGLVANGYPAQNIVATAPSEARRLPLEQDFGIRTTSDNMLAASEADGGSVCETTNDGGCL